jgi:hypothetical protein
MDNNELFTPRQMKKTTHLEIEQAVYVPSTELDKEISPTTFKRRILEVKRALSKIFGGYTAFSGAGGYYMNDMKKLVEEDVVKVVSFSKKDTFEKNKPKLWSRLKSWKKKWKQESIGYENEGDMYYIE